MSNFTRTKVIVDLWSKTNNESFIMDYFNLKDNIRLYKKVMKYIVFVYDSSKEEFELLKEKLIKIEYFKNLKKVIENNSNENVFKYLKYNQCPPEYKDILKEVLNITKYKTPAIKEELSIYNIIDDLVSYNAEEVLFKYNVNRIDNIYYRIYGLLFSYFEGKEINMENTSDEFVEVSKKIFKIKYFKLLTCSLFHTTDKEAIIKNYKYPFKTKKSKENQKRFFDLFYLVAKINGLEEMILEERERKKGMRKSNRDYSCRTRRFI